MVFINLYWKDARSEETSGFCKHKSSSLYNQAVEVIYSFPRSGCDAWHRHSVITIQIAQASEKESNRKYLLMVAQTVRYLARSEWPLKEDGNESDSDCAQLLLHGNHDPKNKQTQQHMRQHAYSRSTYIITIAIAFNWQCSWYSMHDYDPEIPSNSISEDPFLKIFLGEHAPRPPSISMPYMLIMFRTTTCIYDHSLP